MHIADFSIKRPIFITCVFILSLVIGMFSYSRLGVDLYPNVNFPTVLVTTTYPGAGPEEIETLVSKIVEDSVGTLPGINTVRSTSIEGVSTVVAEFTLETDSKYAEQQVKDRVSTVTSKLPEDANQPIVRAFDPSDMPILSLAVAAEGKPEDLFDIVDVEVRPLLEQVKDVGSVDLLGGRKREIHVLLDMNKIRDRQISATAVVNQLASTGKNIPAGKAEKGDQEAVVRTLGEYKNIGDIENAIVSFYGNEVPVRIRDVAKVSESLVDERSRTLVDGKSALTLAVYKRSGANTISVADGVVKRIAKINEDFKKRYPGFNIEVVRDSAKPIRDNVADVTESIVIGIILTILVVFVFLGSIRSTAITGLALPNSLLGAFILMAFAGFTINIMTLLALSLAVGLLIDDAIVVRENIFRYVEEGYSAKEAASRGTREVTLAVIGTTLTIIAVFGPIAFLQGIIGQFFREFGLTICFAMLISLVDALTMAPMLSAYFAGRIKHAEEKTGLLAGMTKFFSAAQDRMEAFYVKALNLSLKFPKSVLAVALLIFLASFIALKGVPKTFINPQDNGEFMVIYEMPAGTVLAKTNEIADEMDKKIKSHAEVERTVISIGGRNGESQKGEIFIQMFPSKKRKMTTSAFKEVVRQEMASFSYANPRIQDQSGGGGNRQPLTLNILGTDMAKIRESAQAVFDKIKDSPDLKDVDISYRDGNPEYRVVVDQNKAQELGVSPQGVGLELRTQIEGMVAAVFRRDGKEYDIRVRMQEDQRNIRENFNAVLVPNLGQRLVRLRDVAKTEEVTGPTSINRQDRGRYIQITAGLNPTGRGLNNVITDVNALFSSGEIKLPEGVRYEYVGDAQNFKDLITSVMIAGLLAVLFIYLVLASLYESFITPIAIMLVLPLAACGAFYALAITGASFDMFSMIGCILLLGVATKNSILLVDSINQFREKGVSVQDAIIQAGRTRLRPIIMTTIALIAGMLPVAIGFNEASKTRAGMGISVIGGLISSTILTLVVVPAAYAYIEKFRVFVNRIFAKISDEEPEEKPSISKVA